MRYRKEPNADLVQRQRDIKNYRLSAALSQEAFAKQLGIPAFRLDKIEKGIQPCPEDLWLKASEICLSGFEEEYQESVESMESEEELAAYEDPSPNPTFEDTLREV